MRLNVEQSIFLLYAQTKRSRFMQAQIAVLENRDRQ